MNFKKYHVSKNLFDYQTMANGIVGKYLGADGSENISNVWSITDYIPVNGIEFTVGKLGGNAPAICLYDASKALIVGKSYNTGGAANKDNITITSSIGAKYARFSWYSGNDSSHDDIANVMLNTGSEPLPYEPYGNTWHDTPHYIHNTSTDTITTLPANIYPNDTTATVGLKGNMVQNGTPSPTTPIQPSECGERTAQIFDKSTVTHGYYINDSNGNMSTSSRYEQEANASDYIPISGDSVTIYSNPAGKWRWGAFYDSNKTYISGISGYNKTITIPENARYMRLTVADEILDTLMVNLGSTALPFEPYGYKIPILSASTTTPIYLGEVETERQIKKLVLTGEENFNIDTFLRFSIYVTDIKTSTSRTGHSYCSHYECLYHAEPYDNNWNNVYYQSGGTLYFHDRRFATVADFKTYLAQQYTNGTPVTIWYVLATPETAVVNEPLRKIGDYADTLSNVTIPVTAGGDTFSVDTTLQPSEATVNYKGWHPVTDVHERDNGAWT